MISVSDRTPGSKPNGGHTKPGVWGLGNGLDLRRPDLATARGPWQLHSRARARQRLELSLWRLKTRQAAGRRSPRCLFLRLPRLHELRAFLLGEEVACRSPVEPRYIYTGKHKRPLRARQAARVPGFIRKAQGSCGSGTPRSTCSRGLTIKGAAQGGAPRAGRLRGRLVSRHLQPPPHQRKGLLASFELWAQSLAWLLSAATCLDGRRSRTRPLQVPPLSRALEPRRARRPHSALPSHHPCFKSSLLQLRARA